MARITDTEITRQTPRLQIVHPAMVTENRPGYMCRQKTPWTDTITWTDNRRILAQEVR